MGGALLAGRASRDRPRRVMIRLALFDIDGTLIHTGGAGVRAFASALASEFGLANATADLSFAGRTDSSLVRECLVRHRIEPSQEAFGRFCRAYLPLLARYLTELPGGVQPGVWEWIAALRALPHRPVLGLLTGNIRQGAEIKLRHFRLWDSFAAGGFGDDSADRNEIAAVARQRGGELLENPLRDDEVLVIGDTALDIACGRAINARVLAVATGGHSLDQLRSHSPDWLVADLTQISPQEVCG